MSEPELGSVAGLMAAARDGDAAALWKLVLAALHDWNNSDDIWQAAELIELF